MWLVTQGGSPWREGRYLFKNYGKKATTLEPSSPTAIESIDNAG